MSIKDASVWLAKQFDSGVTVAGAAVALLLVGSGVGALMSWIEGAVVLGVLLGMTFLILLCGLFLAGHHTDPSLQLTNTQRRERWQRLPAFAKRGLFVICLGAIAGAVLDEVWSYRVTWTLFGVATLLFAQGIRRECPPLPDAKGKFVSEQDSPAEYKVLRKHALLGLYFSAVFEFVFLLLTFR